MLRELQARARRALAFRLCPTLSAEVDLAREVAAHRGVQLIAARVQREKEALSARLRLVEADAAQLRAVVTEEREKLAKAEARVAALADGETKMARLFDEATASVRHYRRGVANFLAKEIGTGRPCGGCLGCGDDSLMNSNFCVGAKWIAPQDVLDLVEQGRPVKVPRAERDARAPLPVPVAAPPSSTREERRDTHHWPASVCDYTQCERCGTEWRDANRSACPGPEGGYRG